MKTFTFLIAVFTFHFSLFTFHSLAQSSRLWATYYGGTGYEYGGNSVTTDASGNVYMAGYTQSNSGIASGGFQNTFGGVWDAFLVKFDANGNRLWATYYGGTAQDYGNSVTTDASGNVYMAGHTFSTSGIASGGFQNTFGEGYDDAFLVKFDANGNRLWATYYGGTAQDYGNSVTTDASGNVYMAGGTSSTSGIASGGFQNTYGGVADAFLVKFNANGNRLWATYYGGTDGDGGNSVTTDASGSVYMAGYTGSTSGIASGGFQNTLGGEDDAFLVKFDINGNRLWATYYGGTGGDYGYSVTTDASGNVYMAGLTKSTSGIASCGFQNTFGGSNDDAFLVMFGAAGNRLWATYYGGMDYDYGYSVTTDASGNVYMAGLTKSTSGIASGGFQNTYGGGGDAFLVRFGVYSPPSVNAGDALTICNGSSTTLSVTTTGGTLPYTYQWSPAAGLDNTTALNPIATPTTTTTYTVLVTDANGCNASDTVQINNSIVPSAPSICVVTVDSLSKYNLVIWDKTSYPIADTFFVYRDTANNNYALIGKVPYTSLSQFIDTVRTLYAANGDP
ncbi:MAG: SBBP repeat-containing protein, partial [Bacteroidota bacterium]